MNSSASKAPYRIMIVDDHPLMREGIANLLQTQSDFVVSGEAADAAQAIDLIRRGRPDIILVDLSLKDSSGFDLLKQLVQTQPDLPALVVSMHDENLHAERAIKTGARGYVMKTEPPEHLIRAIREVLAGKIHVSETLRDRLVKDIWRGDTKEPSSRPALSDRELEVFCMIGEGKTSREIAEALHVSPKTVEAHREHIKKKLGLANSPQLMRKAVEYVQAIKSP